MRISKHKLILIHEDPKSTHRLFHNQWNDIKLVQLEVNVPLRSILLPKME